MLESGSPDQASIGVDEAASTTWPNVNARYRRSAAAWLVMASRAARQAQTKQTVKSMKVVGIVAATKLR
jgi:hypothetical protein